MKIKHVLIAVAAVFICGFGVTGCADFNNSDFGTSHYEFLKTNKNKGLPEFSGAGWYYLISGDWKTDEEYLTEIIDQFMYFDENKNEIYAATVKNEKPSHVVGGENAYDFYTHLDFSTLPAGSVYYFGKLTPQLYNLHKDYLPAVLGITDADIIESLCDPMSMY